MERYPRVASLRSPEALRVRLAALGASLPCDDAALAAPASPLAQPLALPESGGASAVVANRFVIQPMEGWDAEQDGRPSPLTERRWRRFGASGAGWIWGGEAAAVDPAGRANPRQLVMGEKSASAIGRLRDLLVDAAREAGHPEPLVGIQLTHSGRWSAPEPGRRAPRIAFRHPLLDARVGVSGDAAVLSDAELPGLVAGFARAARLAALEGFAFVDLKHCHGYLLHEFLAARTRPGPFGGASLEGRTRLLREVVGAVREAAPGLALGVRLSVFDGVPHRAPASGDAGIPEPHPLPYPFAFGVDVAAPGEPDLAEAVAVVRLLAGLGVRWINVTAASPYYVPHLQRPALFPPSDGYPPPEDPLLGVARLLGAARAVKAAVPEVAVVASGLTYLQDFVPHVAQACVREGFFDAVGLGRMALSYPELPADLLAGRPLARRRVCRTFSDCTTAPRRGLVSGCYPLDDFYRARPERERLEAAKRGGAP
jgi:2,4-dienoyl-CoA reductase-like NADH-dependent reductase (Old Yellow Enzyme family)